MFVFEREITEKLVRETDGRRHVGVCFEVGETVIVFGGSFLGEEDLDGGFEEGALGGIERGLGDDVEKVGEVEVFEILIRLMEVLGGRTGGSEREIVSEDEGVEGANGLSHFFGTGVRIGEDVFDLIDESGAAGTVAVEGIGNEGLEVEMARGGEGNNEGDEGGGGENSDADLEEKGFGAREGVEFLAGNHRG